MAKPVVILLDFDGTIVGDVEWLVHEKNLLQNMQFKYGSSAQLSRDLAKGLLRPHFKYFLIEVKKRFPFVEFFIYTASEKQWADFIIPKVERTIGIKFNRPIFTRNHCIFSNGHYSKRLSIIKPIMQKRLSLKYGVADYQSMILIDNTPVVLNEHHQQVICPSYDYVYPINILRNFPETFSIEKTCEFLGRIHSEFRFKKPIKNSQRFWAEYYLLLSSKFQKAYKHNKSRGYLKDCYWKTLADSLTKMNISTMNSYELKDACQTIHGRNDNIL